MAIITYPLNGITYEAGDAETYLCTRTSGVFDSDSDFSLSCTGGRNVSISTGIAWIRNDDFKGKSVCSTTAEALTFDLADASLGRKDRVVLRFSAVDNASSLVIVKGTPAASPVAPDITRTADVYELGLYVVDVAAGATSITDTDVTDTRPDPVVCGRMGDGVSGLNDLQNQINKLNRITKVNLPVSGWSSSAPYQQTVEVPDMTESSEFWYGYNGTITTEAQADSWGAISSASSGVDAVTFSCYDEKPTVDLPIKIRGI